MQKTQINNNNKSLAERLTEVNNNSAIDNYIIAKVTARNRFILYPQEYELFIESAVKDIEGKIDSLLEDW